MWKAAGMGKRNHARNFMGCARHADWVSTVEDSLSCAEGEEREEGNGLAFGETKDIKKCISCHCKVEADNADGGKYQCLNARGEAHSVGYGNELTLCQPIGAALTTTFLIKGQTGKTITTSTMTEI